MTEEFIPRDTPIYCFVANNEKDLDRARQTRDVWTKRWGYTNFIIQERVNIDVYLKSIFPEWGDIFNEHEKSVAVRSLQNRTADFIYLNKKLKNKNRQSLIIQSNTLLVNDLPKSYLDNHISFLSLNKDNSIDIRNGVMVSGAWSNYFIDHVKTKMSLRSKIEVLTDYTNNLYSMVDASPSYFTNFIENCKTNLEELREKTQEEMHGTFV